MDIKKKYENSYKVLLQEHRKVFQRQEIRDIQNLMDEIKVGNRIFITGAGREGIAARSFAMRLMHLGKEVYWLWDDTTPGMHKGDLFIVINGSGKIGHIDYLIEQAQETGVRVLVITGAPKERTPKLAEICIFIPACVYKGTDERVIGSQQPMGNLFEQHLFLLFDVVVMLLEESWGLSHKQMEERHRNIE